MMKRMMRENARCSKREVKSKVFLQYSFKLKLRNCLILIPASKKGSEKSQDAFKKSPGNFALVKYVAYL